MNLNRGALGVMVLASATSCGPSFNALRPPPPPTPKQCTLFERDPMKPDLMAWDAGQRADVSRLRNAGVIAVRYEQVGCDVKIEVVPNCIGTGKYEYSWHYESDRLIATDEREAFAKLPLGAASLRGELSSGNAVRIDYVLAGQYALPPTAQVTEFKGPGCGRATHYVTAMYVGGFARASGRKEAISAAAGVFGVEGGGNAKSTELSWRTAGSPEGCKEAEKKQSESRGCDMPLRLVLVEKGRGAEPAAAAPVATVAPPQPTPTATATPPAPAVTTAVPRPPPPPAVVSTGGSCPSGMAEIPAGTFKLGDKVDVTLDGYCLDVTEVSVDSYAQCVRAGRCSNPDTDSRHCNWGRSGKGSHPINCVDWQQAVSYCGWAGKALPTEAQWEYAARGGARQLEYSWGNEEPGNRACWDGEGNDLGKGNRKGTCVVGSKPAGAFGLKDMAGNVWEWVADWYGDYPNTASKNYTGPSSGSTRVYRGGSWDHVNASSLRGADRGNYDPGYRYDSLGFRCARTK